MSFKNGNYIKRNIRLIQLLSVDKPSIVSGHFLRENGTQTGDAFSGEVPKGDGKTIPVRFQELAGEVPKDAVAVIAHFTGPCYEYSTSVPPEDNVDSIVHYDGAPIIPAGLETSLDRIEFQDI